MNEHDEQKEDGGRLTRRDSLVKVGGLAATAVGAGAWGTGLLRGDEAEAAGSGPAAVAAGLVSCVLTPEMTEGPYYLDGGKVRRDIREGRPGVPLVLRTMVVDASTCRPVKGAAVDVWHCDAGGTYSGFAQEGAAGRTFLRGIQRTDVTGLARFTTVYPGWYEGRTVHIHVQVHIGGSVVHTGQLFFPGRPDRRRLQAIAVQPATEPVDAECHRLDLPERRQPLDAARREERQRVRREDHHGRQPLTAAAQRR
jgi:protocatechuate 3,4-dioxygenase beta subunit